MWTTVDEPWISLVNWSFIDDKALTTTPSGHPEVNSYVNLPSLCSQNLRWLGSTSKCI